MADEDLAVDQQDEGLLSDDEQEMAKLKEAITVDREEIGCLRLKLGVTVPRAHLDERFSEQFTELRRDAAIPGFRRGHAPMKLVEKRFGHDVGDQLKGQVISKAFMAACEKESFEALGDPLFWVSVPKKGDTTATSEELLPFDRALDHLELPQEGDFSFTCEVEVKPEFELPSLSGIAVTRPKVTVEEDEVDAQVRRFMTFRGTFETVEDAIEEDDMIFADLVGKVDGEVIVEEQNYDLAARDIRIDGIPVPGFGEKAKGHKVGDTVTCEATVPDEYEKKDYRGKGIVFELSIREIKRLRVPELTKEFAESMGFETPDELRGYVRESMEGRLENAAQEQMFEQIGEYLVEKTPFDLPEGLSDRQTERSLARRRVRMLQEGLPESEADKEIESIRQSAHDRVVRDLKLHFILDKIAQERDITVKEERLNQAIAEIAARMNKRFDRVRDELMASDRLTFLYLELRDAEVLQTLLKEASVSESAEGASGSSEKSASGGESKGASGKKKKAKKAAKKKSKKSE